MGRAISSFVLLVLVASASFAADAPRWWLFEERDYFDPLIAGVREPQISALALARADRMAFMIRKKSPRQVWDIDLGAEMPIFGRESRASIDERMPPGGTGWGIWIPIDFHMIEDFVDNSAPIVNTDYRFSVMFKAQHGLADDRWIALRLQLGHESTHLGDEFSIRASQHFAATFERINVSWQYLDVSGMYEHGGEKWFTSIRGGATARVLPFRASYYETDIDSITLSPSPVTPSKNWLDPYAGFEGTREEWIPGHGHPGWDGYVSTELRYRSIYDYHKANPNSAEHRQLSVNVIAGIKKTGGGRASPFVRYYHGVNPHGQFRNQKNYKEYGIGVRFVL